MESGVTTGAGDRRRSHRDGHARGCGIRSVRIRPGHEVTVIDVSAGGVLVEGRHRLLPGSWVELQVQRDGRPLEQVRGQVVRCCVATLQPDAISYRGAIAFERNIAWLTDDCPEEYPLPAGEHPAGGAAWAHATPPAA